MIGFSLETSLKKMVLKMKPVQLKTRNGENCKDLTSSGGITVPGWVVCVEHILGYEKLGMGPHNDGWTAGWMDGWMTDSRCDRICS